MKRDSNAMAEPLRNEGASHDAIWPRATNTSRTNWLLHVAGPTNGRHRLDVSVEQVRDLLFCI